MICGGVICVLAILGKWLLRGLDDLMSTHHHRHHRIDCSSVIVMGMNGFTSTGVT